MMMKPFRKNLAIAIDGGGIRGVIVAKALMLLEQELGYPLHAQIGLAAGTSTGSIIAAGLVSGLEAKTLFQLYLELGEKIFPRSLRTVVWPLFNHRYRRQPLEKALRQYFGNLSVGDLWKADPRKNIVVTTFDIIENRIRFIKPYKSKYKAWPLVKALLASAAAPTYFPSIDGRFIDGGVSSYNNPSYLAAYEIVFNLKWRPEETTLISLGTGRDPNTIKRGQVDRFLPIQYIHPLLGAFSRSADDQQVDLVNKLFKKLDFRRFQVDLKTVIELDDTSQTVELIRYGEQLGQTMLGNQEDRAMRIKPDLIPKRAIQQAATTKSTSRRQTSKSGSLRSSQPRKPAKSARARRKR